MRNLKFSVFTEDDCKMIFSSALEVLKNTGVKIQHKEALLLLREAGAKIEGEVAYFPASLVEKAIQSAPKKVLVYTRDGKLALRLEAKNSYYGTGSDCPTIRDSFTGEFRKFTREDIGKVGVLVDALDNLDFIMSLGLISDKPMPVTDLYQFQQMLFNTVKPIIFTSHDQRGNADIIEIASIAVGSEDNLQEKPFIIHYIEPSSPLRQSKEAVEKLLLTAEKRIPVIYTPCPSAGGTAPITLAGTLVLTLAEGLSGVVLSQLKNKGTPVIIGGVSSLLDMKTTAYLYGAPEFHLMSAGLAEVCQFLNMPMYGTAGCSDSKTIDEQAAIEASFSLLTQSMAGANIIHDVGYLGSGLIGSLDMVVMSNEIIGMSKRIMEGIEVTDETLAVRVIDSVGHGGNYITHEHTLANFRDVIWDPKLMNREPQSKWLEAGSESMSKRINKRVKEILKNHRPKPIEKDKEKEIIALIEVEEETREVEY